MGDDDMTPEEHSAFLRELDLLLPPMTSAEATRWGRGYAKAARRRRRELQPRKSKGMRKHIRRQKAAQRRAGSDNG